MKRFLVFLTAGAVVLSFGIVEKAGAVPVSVPWTGSNTFSDESITFTGFTADSITAITGSGFSHVHSPPSANTASIDVDLNGALTTVGSLPGDPNGGHVLLSSISVPLVFPQGTITGLRISTTGGAEFHAFSDEVFTFNSPEPSPPSGGPAAVPEPSTLLLLGSGLIGLVGFRKGLRR